MGEWPSSLELPDPEVLASLPIFPLPGLVLLPGGLLPLHFFEPRYRALAADCLATEARCMAIANIPPDAAAGATPPILPRACVARIVEARDNPDGTYDVLLEGLARVFLEELPSDDPYRRARARALRDRVPEGGLDARDCEVARSLAADIARIAAKSQPGFTLLASDDDPPGLWVDRLGAQLVPDPDVRQELLEILDAQQRLELVIRALAALDTELRAASEGESSSN